MKQLKKLAFVMAFVTMVTLCAGAMASEDGPETRVTLTVKFVDNVTGEPANGGVVAEHACKNCAVDIDTYSNYDNSDGDTYVELVPGHTYRLTAINNGFYSGDRKEIEVKVDTNSKCTVNEEPVEEVVFQQYIDYDPNAFVELPARKTMDGKAPGAQTFTFDVWKYTREEFDALEDEFASGNFSSLDEMVAAFRSYLTAKDPYATANNDEDGDIVFELPVSPYVGDNDKFFANKQDLVYVVMERMEKGRPVCFDDAVYVYRVEVSLKRNGPPPQPKSMQARGIEYRFRLSSNIQSMLGISSERSYIEPDPSDEYWVPDFQNRTCPFYNPPAAPETPAAPAVPQTGDNSPILVWLALLCISGMALLTLNRKKA